MTAAHGTVNRYKRGGCRCLDCREAVRQMRIKRRELAAANGGVYPGPITHGESGYQNYGCHCDTCTTAHRGRSTDARAVRRAATTANGGIAPVQVHNVFTYNNWGCGCEACRADHAAYQRERKARRRTA